MDVWHLPMRHSLIVTKTDAVESALLTAPSLYAISQFNHSFWVPRVEIYSLLQHRTYSECLPHLQHTWISGFTITLDRTMTADEGLLQRSQPTDSQGK